MRTRSPWEVVCKEQGTQPMTDNTRTVIWTPCPEPSVSPNQTPVSALRGETETTVEENSPV